MYSINLSVFMTEAGSVYCAVRTGSLIRQIQFSSLKGYVILFVVGAQITDYVF
jgi:hypothetical protein